MSDPMNELLKTLTARGLLQDATSGLDERLSRGPVTAYVGLDPTADSLHVGSLVPLIGAAWLQRYGHTPIVLIGGGTGLVGDPSGKRSERPMLSEAEVDRNAEAIRRQVARFLEFEASSANPARLRNNAEWLKRLRLMDFLRDTGKHLTLGFMLQKESVRSRLETGISYTEFSYMVIQAHDFWHLFRTENCELQIGGSDQWGNITAGIELIGKREGRQAYGLVFPLITTSSGSKFGKSEAGNVWLDPKKTTPYLFYQFWINTDDRDLE
jgi:tyrosyl-tRNA synthetase